MKILFGSTLCLLLASAAFAKDKACTFSDTAKLQEHLQTHVKYPAKGKAIKEACKKEMPDEFAKSEKACISRKLKNNVEYKDADEVMKALGMDMPARNPAPAQ